MKRLFSLLFIAGIIIGFLYYGDTIRYFFYTNSFNSTIKETNIYQKKESFLYVEPLTSYKISSYQDLLNGYYTAINTGSTTFSMYCDYKYKNCIKDVNKLSNDSYILSNINNFVNPFNSFLNVTTTHDNFTTIKITIKHLYDDTEIKDLNTKIDQIIKEIINDNMTPQDKIKAVHDYVINTTRYDRNKINNLQDTTYESNKATGVLNEHMGICSGYADTMALFLDKLNIINYKISSDTHVWNLVKLDDKWYHLDATADDPIITNNDEANVLNHDYFLIDSSKIKTLVPNDTNHDYPTTFYKEAQ